MSERIDPKNLSQNQPSGQIENSFKIEDLFGYQNPKLEEYRVLFKSLYDGPPEHRFLDLGGNSPGIFWVRLEGDLKGAFQDPATEIEARKLKDFMISKLQGSILLDLGSRSPGNMESAYYLWEEAHGSQYIGIDLFAIGRGENLGYTINIIDNLYGVKDDMLLALAKMRTGSANITIDAIDHTIIPDEKYHEALATEIIRVCKPGGIVFGINARALAIIQEKINKGELDSFRNHEIDWNKLSGWGHILEKKK